MKLNNKKKIVLGSIIGILLGSLVSVTYAIFSYTRTGNNQQLVTGDIYMHFKESNTLVLENALPSTTYDPEKYFEFTVDGKNTNTKYDIIYDVTLNHGDNHQTRTERLADEFLKFTLMEKKTGESEWTTVVDAMNYNDLASGVRVWKDYITKNQTTEVVHTYRLYMWIDNSVVIGNEGTPGIDYDMDTWNNQVYASVKVTVTGDFYDKKVPDVLYDIVRTGATSDSGIHFYEINGTDNGNGKFVRSTTTSDTYPIYYYRGNVDNNNVIFANKCWKIVRTTETGGTKMIYNGEVAPVYGQGTLTETSYTKDTTTTDSRWTFDSSDNTWNIEINDNSHPSIEFTVPAGNNYSMVMTGTSESSCGGQYYFYKNGSSVKSYGNGGGQPMDLSYDFGTLTSTDKIKMDYQGSSSNSCLITFKIKMIGPGEQITPTGCGNTGSLSQLPETSAWNPSFKSPAYVGYNYGTTAYEYSTANWTSGALFGSSYTWNGTSYTLVGATETNPNATHHYSCNATTADATCSDLRYVYYMSGSTKYYITLQNGKGVEDALKEMLSESTDTIKSPIHETINNWYNTNIKNSYGTYVEDTNWCNDRSVSSDNLGGWNASGGSLTSHMYFDVCKRYLTPTGTNGIQTTNSPVLTCSNPNDVMSVANRKLENPVALLTYDEANLAGLIYSITNGNNYLTSGSWYWLLTPADFENGGANVGRVFDDGNLGSSSVNYAAGGVRPALSLKHGTLVYDGDGSVANPYIAGTPRT